MSRAAPLCTSAASCSSVLARPVPKAFVSMSQSRSIWPTTRGDLSMSPWASSGCWDMPAMARIPLFLTCSSPHHSNFSVSPIRLSAMVNHFAQKCWDSSFGVRVPRRCFSALACSLLSRSRSSRRLSMMPTLTSSRMPSPIFSSWLFLPSAPGAIVTVTSSDVRRVFSVLGCGEDADRLAGAVPLPWSTHLCTMISSEDARAFSSLVSMARR
mmetsp:Transcript_48003/g.124469  ORF Transcript_48003/g.124469 Transcript_48003/m.124469 type:complete len:212 (-) Transcript_48003:813-1448(-)